jgi:THO complex subunit 5
MCRSVYQDIPIHTLEEYTELAPAELKTEDVMVDEHQLMLNRLNFEFSERQKYVHPHNVWCCVDIFHFRLEARRKELSKQKDDLIKQSKTKQTTVDSVKVQLDALLKVRSATI